MKTIVCRTSVSRMTLTYGSWSEGHHDLYLTVQWFCLISWSLFDIWTPYFGIVSQYDLMFDLKINVGRCDLYFMVQWFCLISWRLFAAWTSYFGIMSQYDRTFDLKINYRSLWPKINVGHCSWSSVFALYLENFSVVEHHTLGLWVSMTRHLTWKYL